MMNIIKILLPVFLMAALAACAPSEDADCARTGLSAEVESRIDTLLTGILERHGDIPGISIHVDVPSICVSYGAAAGVEGWTADIPLTPDHAFRIASNTKTYIAVSILRLAEEGRIGLEDPISDYLPLEYLGLLIYDRYEPDKMKIRHMLTHTSGMYEHAGSEYTEMITADPGRKWSRLDQLKLAIELGDPYGAPGETWRYSDTGYILLGKILEEVTGKTMAQAMRDLIGFEKLGLERTWVEGVEAVPAAVRGRAHQYFGDIDSYDVDPSIDLYGGGGLMSTSRDLADFVRLLFEGKVFRRKETLDTMLSMSISPDQGTYRAGIWQIDVDGMTGWGHTGFWNSFVFHFPESGITVAGAITQRNGLKGRALCDEAVRIVRSVLEKR
ncbi:MAG: beta-lactamase family protein [Candidatus Krumholzibacteriota bacterium]|nr:beta-lactamase family protein [Candidatus Krumholzibacteriota bacterium]